MSVVPVMMIALTHSRSGLRRQSTVMSPLRLYPTERLGAGWVGRPRRRRWWAVIGVGCLAAVTACTGSDDGRTDDPATQSRDVPPAVMPSTEQVAGYTRFPARAGGSAGTSEWNGVSAPKGSFWYRVETSASDDQGTLFEWYVYATHLQPSRAYRLDLTVDGNNIDSIGSGASDASGSLTSHGTEVVRFADQYCVGVPTPPLPITGRHVLTSDGQE